MQQQLDALNQDENAGSQEAAATPDFHPRVFLARFVDPRGIILRFFWPDASSFSKMVFGFSWPSYLIDVQVFLA